MSTVKQALEELSQGKMIISTDDANRENEADLVISAKYASGEHINFMATYGKGLICCALDAEQVDRLQLPSMTDRNQCCKRTAFTESVDDASNLITSGISAFDRAITIQTLIHPKTGLNHLKRPGHVFPLRARKGGVLSRRGHT